MNGPDTLATGQAPSMRLPGPFFLAGILFFPAANLTMAAAGDLPIYGPLTLSVTHLITLGWATMVIMGALYQMVPVILGTPIHSEPLGRVQFDLYLLGVLILVSSFGFLYLDGVIAGGTLVVIAGYLFVYNLLRTFLRVRDWNWSGVHIATGVSALFLVITWGLVLALNLRYRFLPGSISPLGFHLALGLIGWFLLVVLGVSLKLVPMFTLAHGFSERTTGPAYLAITGALIALLAAALGAGTVLARLGYLLLFLGLLLYGFHLAGIFRRRHRRSLDISQVHALTGLAFLLAAFLLGGYGLFYRESAGGDRLALYLFFFGFLSVTIMGYLYKIVPFVVWFNKYSSLVGSGAVPLLKEMFSERVARGAFYLYVLGLLLAGAALAGGPAGLERPGFALQAAAGLAFAWQVGLVFRK